MTIEQKLKAMLVENGMFDDWAQTVLDIVKSKKANDAMSGCWNDDVEGYPEQLLAVLWFGVRHTTLEWLNENHPQAWFLPMFEE